MSVDRRSAADGDVGARGLPRWTQTIDDLAGMRPFLLNVASPSDHWLFLSSTGALTAGRKSAEHALFPYRTVDRIHDAEGRVGGKTIVRLADGRNWEPFSERSADVGERSIERSAYGTWVTLVERAHGLEARQTWSTSHEHGVLRVFELRTTEPGASHELRVLDGLLDVLPASVDVGMQQTLSTLIDAYRMTELSGGVATFGLGSIPVDRAEPREALLANAAWCTHDGTTLLCERQIGAFRRGESLEHESGSRGVRSAFLIERTVTVSHDAPAAWGFALEVDQDAAGVERITALRAATPNKLSMLREAIDVTEDELARLLARADAMQCTGSDAEDARHYANTLYNVLRGGIPIAEPTTTTSTDPDERRRAMESLPLALARRHGDPSRPWNRFSIDVRDDDGGLVTRFEGNWRDIFQNWEALGTSYPAFLLPFITKFVNATTADGYNPYRITDEGIDWEVHDPNDPWSFIGYWGDHAIVYLTRLVERHRERFPNELEALLGDPVFVHADVPYRIRSFDDIARNPRETIDYDTERAEELDTLTAEHGADGKLLRDGTGSLVRATLEEKLLVPLLAKLSNLVPGAGVWMNTQRPEWNDANNALVGYGASVVTTCALAKHVALLRDLFEGKDLVLSERSARFLADLDGVLTKGDPKESSKQPAARWRTTEALGRAGETHREAVTRGDGLEGRTIEAATAQAFLERVAEWLDATLDESWRADGLVHAYRTLRIAPGKSIEVRDLPLMLEGQAAALSAGIVRGEDAAALLRALRSSALYSEGHRTYLLYPDAELTPFRDRGVLDEEARAISLVGELLGEGDRSIVREGPDGVVRFAPAIVNADVLTTMLRDQRGIEAPEGGDADALLAAYERAFDHDSFLGRSRTFFGYEGLGCVYWHMVSKLVLAVQETYWRAVDENAGPGTLRSLREAYAHVRAGLGTHRTPRDYGAFPSDPYSHTPADLAARQPGMTGQVKEDILARLGEHGLRARGGALEFDARTPVAFEAVDRASVLPLENGGSLRVEPGEAAMSLCGVPIVLRKSDTARIRVTRADGVQEIDGSTLPSDICRNIWERSGAIERIDVDRATER